MGIPLVALAGEPLPQPKSILTSAAQAGQVQGQDIQNQQGQLQLQQQQQDLKDQKAMTDALKDWDGQSYEQLAKQVVQNGGSGKAALAVEQHGIQVKTAMMGLNTQQLANLQTKHDLALGELSGADKVPDAQLPQYVMNSVQKLTSNGTLTPQEGQEFAGLTQLPPDQLRQQLMIHEASLRGEKAQLAATQSQAQTEEANQKAAQAKAEAEAAKFKESGGVLVNTQTGNPVMNGAALSPAALEMKYDEAMFKKYQGQKLTPDEEATIKTFEHKKELVPAFNFNLQAGGGGGSGPAPTGPGGAALPYDQQIKSFGPKGGVVKAIIEGRQDPPASFAQKSPYWQDVMQKVYSIDPEFNQQRAQLRKDFTVGKHSTEINAINTGMAHVGVLGDAIDALNNNNVQVLNKIANAVGAQVGSDKMTTFNTIVHRVGPEISKAYLGAGGSAGERGADEKDFDAALGPQQLKSNVSITAKLLRSKIAALENQWDQNKAPSMPSFADQFIMPAAKQQLDKWAPEDSAPANDPFAKFGGKPR